MSFVYRLCIVLIIALIFGFDQIKYFSAYVLDSRIHLDAWLNQSTESTDGNDVL